MKKLTPTQERARQKKLKKIIPALQSDHESDVQSALDQLKEHGDASVVPYLIDLYLHHESPEVVSEVKKIFKGLNDEKAVEPILNAVKQDIDQEAKLFLLSSIWEAGLNPKNHLVEITEILLREPLEVMVECMTIADTVSELDDDDVIRKSLEKISEHVKNSGSEIDDDRMQMMKGYGGVLTEKLVG